MKRVKVLTEAIGTLNEVEKEFLWQRIRDSYVEKLGVDPALMADFFPKLRENVIEVDEAIIPSGSCVGLVEIGLGKLVIEQKAKKNETQSDQKDLGKKQEAGAKQEQSKKPDQGKQEHGKQEQGKKQQGDKGQDKQNPKKNKG